jgi:hypothetical protein
MAFLIERKAALAAQLTCPAKSFDPKACYGCCDARPLICTLRQPPQTQETIELRRKKETTNMTALPQNNDVQKVKTDVANLCAHAGTIEDIRALPRFGILLLAREILQGVDPQVATKMAALKDEEKAQYLWPHYCDYLKAKGIAAAAPGVAPQVTAPPPAAPAPAPAPEPVPPPQGLHRPPVIQPPAPVTEAAAPPPEAAAPSAEVPTGKRGRKAAAVATPAAGVGGPDAAALSSVVEELREAISGIRNTVTRTYTDSVDERAREFERMQGLVKHITGTEDTLRKIERQIELLQKDCRRSQLLVGLLFETLVGTIDKDVLAVQLDDIENRL